MFKVNENYGGLTKSIGGVRWITLSAGYTGSVIWGSFFILMSWDRIPTRVAASVFMLACLATIIVLKIEVIAIWPLNIMLLGSESNLNQLICP